MDIFLWRNFTFKCLYFLEKFIKFDSGDTLIIETHIPKKTL